MHFGLVVAVAAVNVALGVRMSEVSRRRADARLFLVSLVFLSSAGFLLLHALATPQILLTGRNAGFAIATPVGLLLAAVFAVVSSIDLTPERADAVLAPPGVAPRRPAGGDGRLGGGVAARAAAAGHPPARGRQPGPADRHGRGRGRPVRAGLGPLLPAAPAAAVGDPDRRPHRLRPARRGHGGGRPGPQLARLLVGVAPADGVRVRLRLLQRPRAVRPGGLLVQPVPRHLPPGDHPADPPRARRRPGGAGRGHGAAPGQRRPAGRPGGGRPGRPLRPDRGPGPGAGAGRPGAGRRARADPAPARPGRRRGRGQGDRRRAPAAGARGRADRAGAAARRAAGRPGRGRAAGVPGVDAGRAAGRRAQAAKR